MSGLFDSAWKANSGKAHASSAVASDADAQLRRVRNTVLFEQLPQGLAATVINASVLAYIQSKVIDWRMAGVWLAAMVLVTALRTALYLVFRVRRKQGATVDGLECWFLAGVFGSAFMWGLSAIVLFPPGNVIHQAFIGFVLAGMTAGAVGAFAASHRAFLTFMLPACVPYTVQLFVHGSGMQVAMGVMTLAFIAATYMTSRNAFATTKEVLSLRFANLELIEQLKTSNEELVKEVEDRQRTEAALAHSMDEAKAATEAKSRFLANMSHEIRTPMNGVIGIADILTRSKLDRRQRDQVAMIQASARTLLTLINDILDLSRIEAGSVELEALPFDLRAVVRDAVDVLAEQAHAKQLDIAIEFEDGVPASVVGDQVRLRQVLVNLVANAVKFTEVGSVQVRVASFGAMGDGHAIIRFQVKDTGIGIDPAVQRKLFEPFRQADSSITRRFGGTGLGLSISHHLVELMGGVLECASERGKGSEFFFSLTLPVAVSETATLPVLQSPSDTLRGLKVLVADEDPVSLETVADLLKSWNVERALATTGDLALRELTRAAADGTPFSVVIAGGQLADMSAVELAMRVGAAPSIAETRLVLLAPANWCGKSIGSATSMFVATLNKPVREAKLYDALVGTLHGSATGVGTTKPQNSAAADQQVGTRPLFDGQVLLVEDNPVNQEVAATYLIEFGCEVHIAENGLEAVAAVATGGFDLVFMDCQMPELDGYEATRRIRSHESERGLTPVPIIALTAGAFASDREECLEAGMNDHIAKPFAPENLEPCLRAWLPERGQSIGKRSDGTTTASEAGSAGLSERPVQSTDLVAGEHFASAFLAQAPLVVDDLRAAESVDDLTAMSRMARKLNAKCAEAGAIVLGELCQALDVQAQMNDRMAVRLTLARILAEMPQLERTLIGSNGEARRDQVA
jgi:two-component system sensor histidine kinase/response regulator